MGNRTAPCATQKGRDAGFVDAETGIEQVLADGGDMTAIGAMLSEIRAKYGDEEQPPVEQ